VPSLSGTSSQMIFGSMSFSIRSEIKSTTSWLFIEFLKENWSDLKAAYKRKQSLPNAITGQKQELVLVKIDFMGSNVRQSGHHLIDIRKALIFLVKMITQSSGQIETTVDTTVSDLTTSFVDSGRFNRIFGLVIFREFNGFAISRKNTSTVAWMV